MLMKNRRNYYRILQVQPDAPAEVIHAAYRTLMRELKQHPDLGGSGDVACLLNQAYEVLSDPRRRRSYDRELYFRHTGRKFSPGAPPSIDVFCQFCKTPLASKPQSGERCTACGSLLQSENPTAVTREFRRSIFRMEKNEKLLYRISWPAKAREALMLDMSTRGARFLCSERLLPGTALRIFCRLFEASAIVTNSRREEAEGQFTYSVGVSFTAVEFADLRGSFVSESA